MAIFPSIVNGEAGASVRGKLNFIGSDNEVSIRTVSEFAEIENEINYFQTGTVVFAEAEQSYYQYGGAVWALYTVVWNFVKFNTSAGAPTYAEGQVYWDSTDHTFSVQTEDSEVTLQVGQEFYVRVVNKTGVTLNDGQVVYINGAQGNRPTVALANAGSVSTASVIGVVTAGILDNAEGYITTQGLVRGYDTSGFTAGDILYLSTTNGLLTKTKPAPPNHGAMVAVSLNSTPSGAIYVSVEQGSDISTLHDVLLTTITDGDALIYETASGLWKNTALTGTGTSFVAFESFEAAPTKDSISDIHGGIDVLGTGDPLSTGVDIVVSKGTGKLVVVVNAGSDIAGTITITGTSVDRNTGATTPADTETMTIDAVTTDGSTVDSNGNTLYSFTGAYISTKWFTGSATLSTVDLTLTDVDAYHVSFEQLNDQPNLTITSLDASLRTTGVDAQYDCYLYSLVVTAGKCDITRIASLNIGADGETGLVNKRWRLRRGNLNVAINGTTDGVWVTSRYANSPATQIESVTLKVWTKRTETIAVS